MTPSTRTFPPDNCWYWFEDGPVIPTAEIPAGIALTERDPSWGQLWHLERLLREAVAWYEGLARDGEAGLPAHMKTAGESSGPTRLHVAQASAYSKIRELKGMVEEHRRALREKRVPRPLVMFHEL